MKISYQTTQHDLDAAFAAYGAVERVNVVTDRDSGQPRGFAFVEMTNPSEAHIAIAQLNGSDLHGRTLNVNEARPKPEKTFGAGRGPSFSGNKKRGPRW